MMNTSSNDLMIADNRFISDTAFEKKTQKKNLQIREPSICLNTTKDRLNSIALKHHKGVILPLITITQPTIKKSEKG